jgi:segregation and condensation protein A
MDPDYKAFTNEEVTVDAPTVVSDEQAKIGQAKLGQTKGEPAVVEQTFEQIKIGVVHASLNSRAVRRTTFASKTGTVATTDATTGAGTDAGTSTRTGTRTGTRTATGATKPKRSKSTAGKAGRASSKRATFRTHTSKIDEPVNEDYERTEGFINDSSDELTEEVTSTVKAPVTADSADGIEILVKLAAAGEFDPKNIDIIDVTDKFLRAIAAAPKENLRQSGKILFHASVLLRMKAEALLAAVVQDVDPQDDFLDFDENGSGLIYDSRKQIVGRQITLDDLERALVRKTHTRQNRQRKVTLEQLIDALREAEKIEKTRAEKKPARAVIELAGQHEARDVDDLLDLAHDEDIEDTIERIERMLVDYTTSGDMINLLALIKMLDGNGDWVDAFLAVLFLSNAGKITLEQQEFYGPLYLVRADEPEKKASSLA